MKIIDKEFIGSSSFFVFEVPASKRVIKYRHYGCQQFYLSMPRIRFFAHIEREHYIKRLIERECYIKRLTVNFIGSDNSSYPAILPNINSIGDVCLGEFNFKVQDDDKLINEIYSSFISTSFTLSGSMMCQFINFNRWVRQSEQDIDVWNNAFIEFFLNWQEKGFEFQNSSFRDELKKSLSPRIYEERGCFFQTYMSLG